MRTLRTLFLGGLTAAFIAGCGGGGGSREFSDGTSGSGSSETVQAPATFLLTKSSPSITSDGRQTVRLFANAKAEGNVALAGVPVTFEASGTGVTIAVKTATTDVNGQAEAVMSVDDGENRSVTLTARTGALSASTTVDVVGTTVTLSGPASVVINSPVVFQVAVKDASGAPVVGKSVQVKSSAGNSVAVSPAMTNAQGTVDLILSPSKSGADILTVSAAGASGATSVQVSSSSLKYDNPPESAEIVVGSAGVPVLVRLLDNGSPVAGAQVTFTATRGVLSAQSALTDANGVAATSITSASGGRSLITATSPSGTIANREVKFVSDRAAKIQVQAAPSTVGVTIPGAIAESSQIVAIVRDLLDNPVKGARVNFTAVDPSAGAGLSQSYALTDEYGRATVTFYPGALPSGANQIAVTGTIDCGYTISGVQCLTPATPPSSETRLTASKLALQVKIGTGNELIKLEEAGAAPVFNELPYGVLVTDSAGNPVSGVALNATVVSLDYGKGYWSNPCEGSDIVCWQQTAKYCPGEDLNQNLRLDQVPFNEDANGDGLLTPGNVATAYFGPTGLSTSATSDTQGSAVLRIRYLRDRSRWVNVRVRVTASVPNGTEGAASVEFLLPILSTDIKEAIVSPPGAVSPYGASLSCP